MESEKLRHFFKIGVALAVASVAFHIVAFTSNGWFIATISNTTFRSGLWYSTTCDGNSECTTVSKREQFEKYISVTAMILYSNVVRQQVVTTTALCCLVVCAVLFAIALSRHSYKRRARIVILSLSTLSGMLIVDELGIDIREVQINILHFVKDLNDTVYFPWSLLMIFFAALLCLSVSCLCFIMEWKMLQRRNQQLLQDIQQGTAQFQQSRNLTILGILFTVVSIAFRIVAFASNGWRIYDTGYTTRYFGLWFLTECRKNGDCETMSMRKYFQDTQYGGLDSYNYSLQVRSEVVLTISLLLSLVCLLLLIIETRQVHSNTLMRLSIMLCALLSGTFWLYDVGHYIRIFAIDLENIKFCNSCDYNTQFCNRCDIKTVYFPWSILFALLGTVFILIFSLLRFVKECQIKETDDEDLENILPMNFSENNGNTNAEGNMSENNVVT